VTAARYDPSAVFAPDDQQLLQDLADRASLSIQNALLYERAQRERERAEQERERAEDANRAKDEFLAMLGHELRNPLSPILTALQLMRLRAGDMLGKERTIIERQVSYMVRLVDDLLDVSRITRGKVQLERRPTQLAEVVACAIEIASPVLEERAHKLVVSVPGLTVQADANRLAQVIANLLTNAAKYTAAQGLIEVSATVLDGSVALSVKDNGVGIEPGLLPRIFELFVQGTQSSDRAQGGLGLGLAIAKTLVEMHGGKLTASSEGLGKGSEFIVELPVIGALTSVAPRPTEAPVQPSVRGGSRKILVVDDNLDAATVLGEVLEMVGHRVSIAHDGPSALEVAEVFRPEVCLLDIGLPVMDGYELARRLVEMLGGDLKLIAITGYGQESDRQRSAESGFHEHLVKPIEFDRLQSVIEELFLENYRPAAAQ
jgi:signal transduction histidine kinase/ActR/RegA family two-component response regulator